MDRQRVVIVDMDGTLCDISPVVHLQAEPDGFSAFGRACGDCPQHRAVFEWCVEHHGRGHAILVDTARDDWSRELTVQWL